MPHTQNSLPWIDTNPRGHLPAEQGGWEELSQAADLPSLHHAHVAKQIWVSWWHEPEPPFSAALRAHRALFDFVLTQAMNTGQVQALVQIFLQP